MRAHLEAATLAVARERAVCRTRKIRARRERLLKHLRAYIDGGRYPLNTVSAEATPIFVDERGNHCAVAALLGATGERSLIEKVARTQNLARVRALATDPALAEWLAYHGITAMEAARIQPAYHAHLEPDWRPTVSIVSGAHIAATESIGLEATTGVGARAGIRRNVHGTNDNGDSQYGSLALVTEYTRTVVLNRGGTNQLALLLQWEPILNSRDAQWYVIGGPLVSIDADDRPGSGLGAELGVGFSFRRRDVPVLMELMGQGLSQSPYASLRLGAQLGVVW